MNSQRTRSLPGLGILMGLLVPAMFGLWPAGPLASPRPGALRLTPVEFSALPGWRTSDPRSGLSAFRRSCVALAKEPADTPMGGAGYAGNVGDWRAVCAAIPANPIDPGAARAWFETWFQPVRVSAGQVLQGLFTGYYEPDLKASHTRHGVYQTPVYGLPSDLVSVDLGEFRPNLKGEHLVGRLEGHSLVPYPDRAEIDAKGLSTAPVLFWARNPVAVFFLHLQGSGRATFEDGSVVRVAYAGQNGQPYTAIGRTLIAMGAIARSKISQQSIRAWLESHPADARRVMETDASFVFFKETPLANPTLGSAGSEGVPLTPEASLAVDPRLHALGVPVFIVATVPDANPAKPDHPFDRLLVAQDTGRAIRGAVRGDVFFGFGRAAGAVAGRMKARGTMSVLLPKPLAARLGKEKDYPIASK